MLTYEIDPKNLIKVLRYMAIIGNQIINSFYLNLKKLYHLIEYTYLGILTLIGRPRYVEIKLRG